MSAAACAGGAQMPAGSGAPLADQIFQATSLADRTGTVYDSPVETTPLTTFVVDGAEQAHGVSDLFIIGTVDRVTGGLGYAWPSGPRTAGGPTAEVVLPFNHPDADISTVHLHTTVETALYRDEAHAGRRQAIIGLVLLSPADVDAINGELSGKKIAAPLLANHKTFFRKETGVYGVLLSGELLGYVGDDGTVEFPALHSLPRLPNGLPPITVEDLLNPPEVVAVRRVGDHYQKDS